MQQNLLAQHDRRPDPDGEQSISEGRFRMKYRIALVAAMVMAGVGVARSEGLDPIAIRQAGMSLTGGDFAFIKSVVTTKADVKQLELPAKAIALWAAAIPSVFPAGSDKGGDTKALPEIWSDRAGFEKISVAAGAAATKLAEAAKASDADAVAVQAKALGEQCGACHKGYRAK
jgi:cytochrome c556